MISKRLLLPFQHGMSMSAVEQAVRLAKGSDATLVLLATIQAQEGCEAKAPRLDLVQQARDFFGAATYKASVYGVELECVEVYTLHVKQAIEKVACEMKCDGIVLFLEGRDGVLLSASVIHELFEAATLKLYVMHLPAPMSKTAFRLLRERLTWWRNPGSSGQEETEQYSATLESEAVPVEV